MQLTQPALALQTTTICSLSDVEPSAWNALTGPADPFLEYEFLSALELSGAVGEGTAWEPRYLIATRGDRLVGAVPFFIKWDSFGEFVFDWAWAEAYERARIRYYPKGLVAAPFTPVSGPRLLVAPDEDFVEIADTLVSRLREAVARDGISGLHFLFLPRSQCDFLAERGFMTRLTYQFHWLNRGYACFEDFLDDLRSSKRKQVRKERREVASADIEVEVLAGNEVRAEHVDVLWGFYADTVARKWSQAYLNRETFERLVHDFGHRLVLVMARHAGRWVAGALNVRKHAGLYGRYWGCSQAIPGLHFECCYYRPIEYAIAEGIEVFEAGAQGEQKFLRGFVTRPVYSAHWLAHAGARAAVARFLHDERRQTEEIIASYNAVSPLKRARRSQFRA